MEKNARQRYASPYFESLATVDAGLKDIAENAIFIKANPNNFLLVPAVYRSTRQLSWTKLHFRHREIEDYTWLVNQWMPANGVRVASYLVTDSGRKRGKNAERKYKLSPEETKALLSLAWPTYVMEPDAKIV